MNDTGGYYRAGVPTRLHAGGQRGHHAGLHLHGDEPHLVLDQPRHRLLHPHPPAPGPTGAPLTCDGPAGAPLTCDV